MKNKYQFYAIVLAIAILLYSKSKSSGGIIKNVPIGSFKIDDALLARCPVFMASIKSTCIRYGFEPALITAQCCVESSLNPNAIGDDGSSRGVMQIQFDAWNESILQLGKSYSYLSLWDSQEINVEVGIGYHLVNARRSGINTGDFLLRSYNGGIGGANSTMAKNYASKVWTYYNAIKGINA